MTRKPRKGAPGAPGDKKWNYGCKLRSTGTCLAGCLKLEKANSGVFELSRNQFEHDHSGMKGKPGPHVHLKVCHAIPPPR